MNEQEPLFREQAVREYVRQHVEGRLLRISPTWTQWVFWLLLSLFGGAITCAAVVQVDRWVTGTAVVRPDGSLLAVFAAHDHERLGHTGTLVVRFLGNARAPVERIHPEIVGPAALRAEWPDAADLLGIEEPVAVIEARLDSVARPGQRGRVEVHVGRDTILDLLRPGRH